MIFVVTINLIVQEEVVEHPLQPRKLASLEPGKHIGAQWHVHPFTKILWFGNSHLTKLWPDGNAGIRSEDIWRETDIRELTADVAHGLEGDDTVGFCLAGIGEDQVEGDANSAKLRLARGLVHLVD